MDAKQAKALREPFPASAIGKLPKGGVMLDYVGHAATTDRLLAVDPEWTWEPLAFDAEGLPAIDKAGNLWIRLTICGVTRIGCGDGKTMKERIGDAIRNAAMRFGVALDLWAKEDLHEIALAASETPAPEKKQAPAETGEAMKDKTRAQMFALLNERGITDKDAQVAGITAVIGRHIDSRSELTEAEAQSVIRSLRGASAA
jgi:hypothetical protein